LPARHPHFDLNAVPPNPLHRTLFGRAVGFIDWQRVSSYSRVVEPPLTRRSRAISCHSHNDEDRTTTKERT
jgi:hypothetical protein